MDVCTSTKAQETEEFPPAPVRRAGEVGVWRRRLRDDRAQLIRYWPVIQNLVMQELRVRYQRSLLGFFWTLLNPLLMMTTLSIFFSAMSPKTPHFPVFVFAGMVPWGFLSGSINECATCIIQNEGLIRKIYLPKLVFPITRLLINLITMALSLGAMFLLLGPMGARPSLPMVLLPAALVLFMAFAAGLGLLVATTNTFFRDCGHLVAVFLQAWYFATPIVYRAEEVFGQTSMWMFRINPAYYFIELFHAIIYEGLWPATGTWLLAFAIAVVSLGMGYAVFKSQEDKMVFRL
ncbi:Teichoic acid translocation permease protein TagG [Aquisphaera giovannonii]|uniref:Transport permease protein n=1 Tax=Aquisphaera giovannonii TaxID=406548 RepID=A0A5B9W182_9BACT|nr:ABC transporter permease [Aquisphaera giovannonii]QEH33730.1 Teichoic acid translocation permease protein TagG [Aquisphaera giovannonii]